MAYLPGAEGGRALAEILFGEVNPSGKLPFTYPSTPNGFTTYDHKPLENTHDNPAWWQWPFGHGLSYTTFAYSNLALSAGTLARGGALRVSVDVRNTGQRAGKEVVQLYVSDLYRTVSPPVKELKGFEKIALAPGETKTVSFTLTAKDLEFVGLDNKWQSEPGDFLVRVGGLEAKFALQ
jgi:beta-glucosidase